MEERVASVLETAFPDRAVAGVRSAGVSWSDYNRTVAVGFEDGATIYLKVAVDGDDSRIVTERAMSSYADTHTRVRVPDVLACDTDAPTPYLATAPIAGQFLSDLWWAADVEERAAIARAVGETVAGLHTNRFEEHGRVVGGDAGALALDSGAWTDVLVAEIDESREKATSDRFEHHFDDVIEAVEANRALLDGAPAALLHGDPAQGNCFRGDDGTIGFIDWENAHAGDPARELCRVRAQQIEPIHVDGDERVVHALHAGYRERAGELPAGFEERRPVYEVVTFLWTAAFFDKWAPDADEPTEELAAWVRAEMDRRLAEA